MLLGSPNFVGGVVLGVLNRLGGVCVFVCVCVGFCGVCQMSQKKRLTSDWGRG